MIFKRPKKIPTNPGVYIFRKQKSPLYVGKAANLKKRVSSYFKKNPGWKVEELRREATQLEFIVMKSEIEALIKEAELIKRWRPKYNILMRDDKSYTYIALTNEKFSRFYFTHQPVSPLKARRGSPNRIGQPTKYIGPFVESGLIHQALKMLRRVFPYCTCKKPHNGRCLNAQIGRDPGYCCEKGRIVTDYERKTYQKHINAITLILSGKKRTLLKELTREMRASAKRQEFEKAAKLRDQVYGLESLAAHRGVALPKRAETPYHKIERVLQNIFAAATPLRRVEAYDIANISGKDTAASMIVFYDGKPDKSQYRKFKIKTVAGANDVASIREALSRRLAHQEWEYPNVVVIDGGKPQLSAALAVLNQKRFRQISIAALSKPPRKLFSRAPSGGGQAEDLLYIAGRSTPIAVKSLPPPVMYFLQRLRDESHRFARAYHHLLRRKSILK